MSQKIHVLFPCQPGKGPELLEIFRGGVPATREFPGNEGVEVLSDADDPDTLIHLQTWADRASREAYLAYLDEAGLTEVIGALMTGPWRSTYLEEHPDV